MRRLIFVAFVLAGCKERPEMLVRIDVSGLSIPDDLDALAMRVIDTETNVETALVAPAQLCVPGMMMMNDKCETLPATVLLVPGDKRANHIVEVHAIARKGGTDVIDEAARFRLQGGFRDLSFVFYPACKGNLVCGARGLGCDSNGACVDLLNPQAPRPDAGIIGFNASNVSVATVTGVDAGAPPDVVCDPANCPMPRPLAVTMDDGSGSFANLYVLRSLVLAANKELVLTGPYPIVLWVIENVEIRGRISVAASGGNAGPGGFNSSWTLRGLGGGENDGAAGNTGGGGAGYCGVGGKGGALTGTPAAGGMSYGNEELIPLRGGSAGGEAGGTAQCGGGGGGALQITAGGSITVHETGTITAAGGAGDWTNTTASCGAGSGGAILLEAPSVTIAGRLAANGGGGGAAIRGEGGSDDDQPAQGGTSMAGAIGGQGGAGTMVDGTAGVAATDRYGGGGGGTGRIRINTRDGNAEVSGLVSPAITTTCATVGTLR